MRRTDEIRKLKVAKDAEFERLVDHLEATGNESVRIGGQFGNIDKLLDDIDVEFAKVTGIINKKDLSLLFVATGLLCAKWIIMGQLMPLDFNFSFEAQEKVSVKEGKNLENSKREEHNKYGKDKISDKEKKEAEKDYSEDEYRSVHQILFRPVPYDTNKHIVPVPMPMGGPYHRGCSLGHDELLGWIFGTINIMTRSFTFKIKTLDTFITTEKNPTIKEKSNIIAKVKEAFDIFCIEHERLYAAVFKQGLHFLQDKYTATGLPRPFMSAEEYMDNLKQGWDPIAHANTVEKFKKFAKTAAKDAAIVAIQFAISLLINEIIKAIHLFLYDEQKDGDIKLYQVRTRKILITANCISSASNILVSTGIAIVTKNPIEGIKRLDIGGFIETLHRLIVDTKFIKDIKREYIQKKLYEKIYDSDFNWLYQTEV